MYDSELPLQHTNVEIVT